MGTPCFTDELVKELEKDPNEKRVSHKCITHEEKQKEHFIAEYAKDKPLSRIFMEIGFDISYVGDRRIRSASNQWRTQSKRLEGLMDTRKGASGRPRMKHLSQDEIIERQKVEIEYLKQEPDFLLEIKRLERQAIRKQKLSQKKSSNSSNE